MVFHNLKIRLLVFSLSMFLGCATLFAQQISKEEMIFLTQQWKGERFEDGRPKVSDDLLTRMRLVTHDEAWAVMKNAGYLYQYTDGWEVINPDSILIGRAVTATFIPGRPDIHDAIDERGKRQEKEARTPGRWIYSCLGTCMWLISLGSKSMALLSETMLEMPFLPKQVTALSIMVQFGTSPA